MTGNSPAAQNKRRLKIFLGQQLLAKITGPSAGFQASWIGHVIGVLDEPALLLELQNGQRVMLPQSFNAELAEGTTADQAPLPGRQITPHMALRILERELGAEKPEDLTPRQASAFSVLWDLVLLGKR